MAKKEEKIQCDSNINDDELANKNGEHKEEEIIKELPLIKNGNSNGTQIPPKPLPRTSRNNSVSEQGNNGSTGSTPDDTSVTSRPVARPRSAATYKVCKKKTHLYY